MFLTLVVYLACCVQALVTIPLTARRSVAHNSRLDVPLRDYIKHHADLQWYAPIKVGTPPQVFNVIFDTGSYDMFIPQNNCSTCNGPLFNPSASRTFASNGTPASLDYGTGIDTTPLPKAGEGVSGHYASDTVGLGPLSVPEQQFLLCDRYDEFMNGAPFDGIMGIGPVNQTNIPSSHPWLWSLYYSGQLASPAVSFYFPPGHPTGAEMTLGGINHHRYKGDIKYVDIAGDKSMYMVSQSAMYIAGEVFKSNASSLSILDTGTPFLLTDRNTTEALYARISPHITEIDPLGAWGAPCDVMDQIAVDLTFTFGSVNVTVPREAFNLGPYKDQQDTCQAVFSSAGPLSRPDQDPLFILGAPLLKQYYTIWDGLNGKIGFGSIC